MYDLGKGHGLGCIQELKAYEDCKHISIYEKKSYQLLRNLTDRLKLLLSENFSMHSNHRSDQQALDDIATRIKQLKIESTLIEGRMATRAAV